MIWWVQCCSALYGRSTLSQVGIWVISARPVSGLNSGLEVGSVDFMVFALGLCSRRVVGSLQSLRLISQLTYLLRTLSPLSFQLWEAPMQSQGQLRQEKLKLKQKPYKTMDRMVVSIHYKYNSYFSTNNIGS